MSITVRKTFAVDGTPTNVTTFTIGVVRADSGATVVTAGTAMTNDSTGRYSHTFAEPTTGLTYTATFIIVYAGNTTTWEETIEGSVEEQIPMPALTGDTLADTIAALEIERLRVSRAGPKVTYTIDGQTVKWGEYMRNLDERIANLRREQAMSVPVEEIGIVW